MSKYIAIHIIIYTIYLIFYSFFPYQSEDGNTLDAVLFICFYLIFIVFADFFINQIFKKVKTSHNRNVKINKFVKHFDKHITKVLIVGILFLGYDYFIVKGVNIFGGLSSVRYFLNNELNSTGISSPYSVLGYLFLLITFSHAIAYSYFFKPTKKNNWIIIVATLFISLLTGGRTTFLLLIGVFLFNYRGLLLDLILRLRFLWNKKIIISIISILFFINYIFYDRATSNDGTFSHYTENMANWLGGEYVGDKVYDEFRYNYVMLSGAYELTGMYAFHSLWTLEGVLNTDNHYGNATFNNWRNILAKFGLSKGGSKWLYSQRFISWQGGLYYDFGILFIIIILLFLLVGKISLKKMHNSILGILTYSVVFMTFMFSPIIIFTDILVYPVFVFTNILYVICYQIYKINKIS